MKKATFGLAVVACTVAGTALAQVGLPKYNYPTQARIEFVFDCMRDLGGADYTTMYKCTCAIDSVANQIPYKLFMTFDTFMRGRSAAGERPEILREGKAALSAREAYAKVLSNAAGRCIIEDPDFVPEVRGWHGDDEGKAKAGEQGGEES